MKEDLGLSVVLFLSYRPFGMKSWDASMGLDKDLRIWIKFSCTPEAIQLTA